MLCCLNSRLWFIYGEICLERNMGPKENPSLAEKFYNLLHTNFMNLYRNGKYPQWKIISVLCCFVITHITAY
jgi:hypothetical protein